MFVKLGGILLVCLVLLAAGCGSKPGDSQTGAQANAQQTASAPPSSSTNVNGGANPQANSSANPSMGNGFLNACAMINNSEIAGVQGAQVQSTTPSTQMNGDLAISQCYYALNSADGSKNLSVHLEVIQADPKSPNAVKEYWERAFGDKDKNREKGEEEEKESGPPRPVRGVGEEAFWIGNAKVGALYALKKGKLVRISIGGVVDIEARLQKSKTLMEKALTRI